MQIPNPFTYTAFYYFGQGINNKFMISLYHSVDFNIIWRYDDSFNIIIRNELLNQILIFRAFINNESSEYPVFANNIFSQKFDYYFKCGRTQYSYFYLIKKVISSNDKVMFFFVRRHVNNI
jgi:hypothetical protein